MKLQNRVERLDENGQVVLPAMQIPSFRTSLAIEKGVERNLLMKTWGGLGDQICAEPAIRYALKSFKECEISLASEHPELFSHHHFKKIYDLKTEKPNYSEYFVFDMIRPPTDLQWEFMSHMLVNCVDYPALCAFRCQLPVSDREIILTPEAPGETVREFSRIPNGVFIHPGKHWPSKTFPKQYWDEVLHHTLRRGLLPIIIGENTGDNRGTVDVNAEYCIDLRNKLSIFESVWLLQHSKVLITNDSSPLHMAASYDPNDSATGKNWIGFIATCKHPDFISHWRKGVWNYRQENLGLGGLWETIDNLPNKSEEVSAEFVEENVLRSWLPSPEGVADWALKRIKGE